MKLHLQKYIVCFIFFFTFLVMDVNGQNRSMGTIPSYTNGSLPWLEVGQKRLMNQERAMRVLLGWGNINLIGGSLLLLKGSHSDFYSMMAGWGIVNTGIAAFALFYPDKYDDSTPFSRVLRDELKFNRILAINSGLNIAYIATGICMTYMGNSTRIREYGIAIALQGVFLAIFDTVLLLDSNHRLNKLSLIPFSIEAQTMLPQNHLVVGIGLNLKF